MALGRPDMRGPQDDFANEGSNLDKALQISLIGIILSVSSIGRAATIGNIPEMQGGSGRYSLGIEYDSLANRDMTFDSGSASSMAFLVTTPSPFPDSGSLISGTETKSKRILLRGAVNLMSRLDFYVKLGIADAELGYTIKSPAQADRQVKFDGSLDFAYGTGFKARMASWGGWTVISDLQFLRYEVEGDYTVDGKDFAELFPGRLIPERSRSEAEVQELQLAVYLTGKIGMMTPYAGFKISDLTIDIDNEASGKEFISLSPATESRRESHESADQVGVFLGTGLEMNGPWTANIEIRFIDETAVSVGINRHY